ncbi:ankyrin repeat family protein [Carex rostrata]
MAVPGGRNGMEDDDDEQQGVYLDGGGSDAWADVDHEVPAHLRPLVDSAQSGDLDSLRTALDNYDGTIDDPVEDGDTVLHLACLYGHLACVEYILQRGANLEIKDEEGAIPLHDACAGGFTEIVSYILNFASNNPECITRMLNTVDVEGDTPLHHAARGEQMEVVKILLEAGASPNKTNAYGQTPAELADQNTEVRAFLTAAEAANETD